MNSVLLSIGIAVVLALVAALVAPFFIDWGTYRSFFEERASRIVGAPVTIEGDLSVRLLPRPFAEASDIVVGDKTGFRARGMTLQVGLTPLMSGDIDVEKARLVGPEFTIDLDRPETLARLRPSAQTPDDVFRVQEIEIVDARVRIVGAAVGGERMITAVNAVASAGNLDGPYKAEGSLRLAEEIYDFSLATGRWNANGDLRTKLSLTPRGWPVAFDADGEIGFKDDRPNFAGRVRLERLADAVVAEEIAGDDVAGGGLEATQWLFRADALMLLDRLVFDTINFGIGDAERRFTFEGHGNIDWSETPRFDLQLAARQADLDRALGKDTDQPASIAEVIERIGGMARSAPPIPGSIGIGLERVVLGGSLVEEIGFDLDWDDGEWRIDRALARLPGDSILTVENAAIGAQSDSDSAGFKGRVGVLTGRGQVLADWLGEDLAAFTGWLDGPLEAGAQIEAGGGRVAVDALRMRLDGKQLDGAIAIRLPAPGDAGRIDVELAGEEVRFDALRALWAGMRGGDEASRAGLPDVSIKLDLAAVSATAVTARDVMIDAGFAGGVLALRQLSVADLGGARIDARGDLGGVADRAEGELVFTLEAQSLEGAAGLLEVFERPGAAAVLQARAGAWAPLSLEGRISAAGSGERELAFSAGGSAAATRVDLSATLKGALDNIAESGVAVLLNLAADNAVDLAEQLGLAAGSVAAPGPGALRLELSGVAREGLDVSVQAEGLNSRLEANGSARFDSDGARTLDFEVGVDADGIMRLLTALDMIMPPVLAADMPGQLSLKIEGRNPLALRDVALRLGGADELRASGDGTLTLGAEDRPHRIDLDVTADALSLPAVLDAVYGPERFAVAATQAGAFSAEPFAISLPQRFEIAVDLDLTRLEIAPWLILTEATAQAALKPDGLRLTDVSGTVHGGVAEGALTLSGRSGTVSADGRLRLEEARLESLVWRRGGRAVASGTLSADVTFSGAGRSLSTLIASLSGEGAVRVGDGSLRGLSPVAFDRIVQASDSGTEIDEARARELLSAYLDQGALDFQRADMTFSVAGGMVRATRFAIDGDGLNSFVTGEVDLGRLEIDSAWSVRAPPDPDAPDQVREFGIVFDGPLRQPMRRLDVQPLIGYLTIRAFEREVGRLEGLQAEIHERGRLQRELDWLIRQRTEERRAREAAEQEAREQESREQAARERAARQREARQQEARERAAREQAERERGVVVEEPLVPPDPLPQGDVPITVAPVAPDAQSQAELPAGVPVDSRDPRLPQNATPAPRANAPQGVPREVVEPPQPVIVRPRPRRQERDPVLGGFGDR